MFYCRSQESTYEIKGERINIEWVVSLEIRSIYEPQRSERPQRVIIFSLRSSAISAVIFSMTDCHTISEYIVYLSNWLHYLHDVREKHKRKEWCLVFKVNRLTKNVE